MAKEQTFEEKLEQLESIVVALEEENQTLEEALTAFEDGVKLVKKCKVELTKANQKIDTLFDSEK